jgi:TonB family protein
VTWDKTTGASFTLAVVFHGALALTLGFMALSHLQPATDPLLIEVTLQGTSAPLSTTEGVKASGEVVAPKQEDKDQSPAMTAEQLKTWQAQRRQQMIKELSETRGRVKIGSTAQELRKHNTGLAQGRGAGAYGQPGSPKGTLSLTGAIASRGFQEPDFSSLKSLITEETQLRLNLVVSPSGEVKQASLFETSGFPYVDSKALDIARTITFDPLPSDWKQEDQSGVLTVKLKL